MLNGEKEEKLWMPSLGETLNSCHHTLPDRKETKRQEHTGLFGGQGGLSAVGLWDWVDVGTFLTFN